MPEIEAFRRRRYSGSIERERFLEIAFEAELDTSESPEMLEMAELLCHESPHCRPAALEELRALVYENGECSPHRTDDAFLLRYLRARKFVVRRAYRLLVRHWQFREQYPALYRGVELWSLLRVQDAYEGTMLDHPDVGRVSIFRFGMWEPEQYPVQELVRAGMAMSEIGIRQPKLQVLGGVVIVDLEGIGLRHVATLTPTVAFQIVALMGLATPNRLNACHIVNYSWILNTFFYMFKRFIPRGFTDRVLFHGHDVAALAQHVPLEALPPRYGGTCESHVSFAHWLERVRHYRDEAFDRDMRALGYELK